MKKVYEAPVLMCEEFAPDTMIASRNAKNGNAGNNHNCWGCRYTLNAYDPKNPENDCLYLEGSQEWINMNCE